MGRKSQNLQARFRAFESRQQLVLLVLTRILHVAPVLRALVRRDSHLIPEVQEAPLGSLAPADLRSALEADCLSRQALRRTPARMDQA